MMKSGMTGKFLDGIKIADDIKREVSAEVQTLKEGGIQPGLAVVLVGDDAASSAYVNMKAKTCEQLGIYSRKLTIPSSVTTEQLLAEVQKLNRDDAIDGILVQLPLPKIVRQGDIVVAAIGKTAMVKREWVKPGAVVIDVGTNKVSDRSEIQRLFGDDPARWKDFEKRGYVWAGDVDERGVMEVASLLTPVPGGVGPMTIAILMKNTLKAARMRRGL